MTSGCAMLEKPGPSASLADYDDGLVLVVASLGWL
jgi:hypothetical protein